MRNYLCIECNEGPICPHSLVSDHHGHHTLQIRKASRRNAIRVCDIQQVVGISEIECYIINNSDIVFLLGSKNELHHGSSEGCCVNCKRRLHSPCTKLMCSIECKFSAQRNILAENDGDNGSISHCDSFKASKNFVKNRRKQSNPCRAPFF